MVSKQNTGNYLDWKDKRFKYELYLVSKVILITGHVILFDKQQKNLRGIHMYMENDQTTF